MANAFFRYGKISKVAANDAERSAIVAIHFAHDSDWVEKTITDAELESFTFGKLRLEVDGSNELVKTTFSFGLGDGENRYYKTGEALRSIIDNRITQIELYLKNHPNDNFGWSTYLDTLKRVKVSEHEDAIDNSIMVNFNTDKNLEEQLSDAGHTVKSIFRLP